MTAFQRLVKILHRPEGATSARRAAQEIMVETFIPGREVALEGLLTDGKLRLLTIFDKPDPLDGPFFEETIYVTPSRFPTPLQEAVAACTADVAAALGLRHGPVHAELRINEQGPWPLEIAPRSIGGLCSRTLRFGSGLSLEDVILRHAMGHDVRSLEREKPAAGVMMIPIPRAGILRQVRGLEEARQVPGIDDISITIPIGHEVVPLPEGSKYLGFIFARDDTPAAVEAALRASHGRLTLVITPADEALAQAEHPAAVALAADPLPLLEP
jgi:biotin carboxylase